MDDAGVDDEHIAGVEGAEIVRDEDSAAAGQNLHNFNPVVVRMLAAGKLVNAGLPDVKFKGHVWSSCTKKDGIYSNSIPHAQTKSKI